MQRRASLQARRVLIGPWIRSSGVHAVKLCAWADGWVLLRVQAVEKKLAVRRNAGRLVNHDEVI